MFLSRRAYVGVSPKYTNEVEIEYGISKQDPYFKISEKNAVKDQESRAVLSHFCLLLGPCPYYCSCHGNVIFPSEGVLGHVPKTIHNSTRLENSKRLVKFRVFIGDVATRFRLPCVKRNIFFRFWEFSCAAGSQLRVHESTSCAVPGCLGLLSGAPDTLTHPIRTVLQCRGRS